MSKVLEIQLDLDLTDEDLEKLAVYKVEGLDDHAAQLQVAQDRLGFIGAVVQQADLVDY